MTSPHPTSGGTDQRSGVEIELVNVSKKYPGQTASAVDDLSITLPAGEIIMFVGPSGCGKTTSLKMINRLIEPTAGRILINGRDVTDTDATQLRRKIGYVIQGGGLLPHLTVGDNVALVPQLLKWDGKRITARVDELLEMVGLDPSEYRDRFPRELSGGQQQRVGVARGLAADPPVLLMDEPFGAVDPITRAHLQDELMDIQAQLRKTIVFVTHDIDEAVKLGDRILVLQRGAQIAQYDTPENILAAPANEFVEDFVGSGATLKQLNLRRVGDMDLIHPPTARIGEDSATAVERAQQMGADSVVILDDRDRPREWLTLRQLRRHPHIPTPGVELQTTVDHRSTLNDALNAMLASSHGGAMVTRGGKFIGVLPYDTVTDFVRTLHQEAAARAEENGAQEE